METAGLITIPSAKHAYYKVTPPKEDAGDRKNKCANIPAEMTNEKAACEGGKEGPQGGLLLRIGRIDGNLQMNVCEPIPTDVTKFSQVESAVYAVNAGTATVSAVRTGTHNGHSESNKLDMSLNGIKSITDGIPIFDSASGNVTGTASMSGGFGGGKMTYIFASSDNSVTLAGAFGGKFTEGKSGGKSEFTGKVFSKGDGTTGTGCTKFSSSGTYPAMRGKDLVPFNVTSTNKAQFLSSLSLSLGIQITEANLNTTFLCMNKNFDPKNPSSSIKPLVAATVDGAGYSCPSITQDGIECYSITNITSTDPFGKKDRVEQIFTTVANATATHFTVVDAADLSKYTIDTDAFTHLNSWDCAADAAGFTELDFAKFSATQLAKAGEALKGCFSLEEKARGNSGMGGYDCGKQEGNNFTNGVNEKPPTTGKYGGSAPLTNNCGTGGQSSVALPGHLMLQVLDEATNKYCLPVEGGCKEFTVNASSNVADNLTMLIGDLTITKLTFTLTNDKASAVVANISKAAGGTCTATGNMSQPTHSGQPPPDNKNQADQGKFPKECLEKKLTFETCGTYCLRNTCTPPA